MSINGPLKNLRGQRFGALVAESYIPGSKTSHASWLCRCDCGKQNKVSTNQLLAGRSKSCGCLVGANISKARTAHGHTAGGNSRTYRIWANMITRCHNPKAQNWAHYGGRGIAVCNRWRDSFSAFLADMGPAPERLTLDRINSDGPYEPGNCRWASMYEQAANKRTTRVITVDGQRMTVSQASERFGVSYSLLHSRLAKGWEAARACTAPVRKTQRSAAA
jgi:hypothetical protein